MLLNFGYAPTLREYCRQSGKNQLINILGEVLPKLKLPTNQRT